MPGTGTLQRSHISGDCAERLIRALRLSPAKLLLIEPVGGYFALATVFFDALAALFRISFWAVTTVSMPR